MDYIVKKFGKTGLHITLSKKKYREGDIINIPDDQEKINELTIEMQKQVEEIFEEKIRKLQGDY